MGIIASVCSTCFCGLLKSQGVLSVSTGTVKWFSDKKGYGFIVPEEGGGDIFVHHSEIKIEGGAALEEGQKVEYDTREGEKGPVATNVKPI
jgi:CspA family cold shock protein